MFTTKVEALINSDIEKVFSYVRNFETMPKYNSSVKESNWIDDSKQVCKISLNLSVINIQSEYKIIEIIDNKNILAKCVTSSLEFQDLYEFSEREGKTYLSITDEMSLKGLLSFSEGLLSGIFKKEMNENLARLVKILET